MSFPFLFLIEVKNIESDLFKGKYIYFQFKAHAFFHILYPLIFPFSFLNIFNLYTII